MEYFSEAHFRAITNRMSLYEQRTYSDNYQGLPMNEQFDIFLSYNISDSDVVKGIFYALSNMGFKVYLDCIVDANMKRNETDKNTAKRIQQRLKNSKSLIYAQSPDAGKSKRTRHRKSTHLLRPLQRCLSKDHPRQRRRAGG